MSTGASVEREARPRRLIVAGWLLFQFVGVLVLPVLVSSPSSLLESLVDPEYLRYAVVPALGLLAMHAALVTPVSVRAAAGVPGHGRPLAVALGLGVGISTLVHLVLALGVWTDAVSTPLYPWLWAALALVSAAPIYLYLRRRWAGGAGVRVSLLTAGYLAGVLAGAAVGGLIGLGGLAGFWESDERPGLVVALVALVAGWVVSTPIVIAYARGRAPEAALARIARTLFAGSIIETACLIPIDLMVRRRSNCYCAEASYYALIAAAAVGLIAIGPAFLLLPIGRRSERRARGQCPTCGYDRAGVAPGARCPECGGGSSDVPPR